jgi:prolipoprotein diacylglyceryltransferase
VNEYSLLVGMGASLAILRVVQNVPRWQAARWANAGLLVLLSSLIGARLVYVICYWGYFQEHLVEALALWKGGFSWFGAVVGGIICLFAISRIWHMRFSKLADGLVPMIPPLAVTIWMGCWAWGIAYGPLAPPNSFWGIPTWDESGVSEMRLPLQLLAAFALLVYCFWLEAREKSFKREGQKAALMLLGLSVNLLLFMPLRADPAPGWLGVRLDVWAAIAFFIPSLVVFLITQRGRVEQNSTLLHGKGT